jgi:hypothetical protein
MCTYATHADHGYFFCDSVTDRTTAYQNCAKAGMKLAHINDADENQFIDSVMHAQACCPNSLNVNPQINGLWIGGNDGQTEDTWVWDDDLTPFWMGRYSYMTMENGAAVGGTFASWDVQQPSYDHDEDCLRTTGHLWRATPCLVDRLQAFVGLGYLCEDPTAP